MSQAGSGIADAQQALRGQGRQTGFGLADQIDRQEPEGQRQMSALEHGARGQRRLRAARPALKGSMRSNMEQVIMGVTTTRTTKPVGPAGALQRRFALRFGAKLLMKRGQRQARLELNAIHRHDTILQRGLTTSVHFITAESLVWLKNLANQVV